MCAEKVRNLVRETCTKTRLLAFEILLRVERDKAYAERLLTTAFKRHNFHAQDKAFATELVYGTIRKQRYLDFLIDTTAHKKSQKFPLRLRVCLRLGIYQLVYMRVAEHSAVHESVLIAKKYAAWATGLVNAILRRIASLKTTNDLPQPKEHLKDAIEAWAIYYNQPTFLVEQLLNELGQETTMAWLEKNSLPAPLWLSVNSNKTTRQQLYEIFIDEERQCTLPELFPDALVLSLQGDVCGIPGFDDGLFWIQDGAAQLVSRLLGAQPGDQVLDVCAAPGGKSLSIANRIQPQGCVVACDIHLHRMEMLEQNITRMSISNIKTLVCDATNRQTLSNALKNVGVELFDKVVVDAPCTGLGTTRRHPELVKTKLEDVRRLVQLQWQILTTAATFVKPGGILLYAVCTPVAAEGHLLAQEFLAQHKHFVRDTMLDQDFAAFGCQNGELRLWTHQHDTDSFYACRLRRT